MSATEPGEASKIFENCFAAGDLDGLMDLYEPDAVFASPSGTATGLDQIREVLQGYLSSNATITMEDSVAFTVGDLALVHWSWTMKMPDGSSSTGGTAEVLRRQADGLWKFVIDNPDGPALISHD